MSLKKLDSSNTITSSSNTNVAERSSRKSESDCSYLSVHSDPAETSSMKTSKSDSALYVKDVSTKWSIVRWVYALTKYSALSTPSMNFNDSSFHTHPHHLTLHFMGKFSVVKATLQSPMSDHLSVCQQNPFSSFIFPPSLRDF